MELRNHVEWALHCCGIMAGLEEDQRVSTKALAEFHGVPKEYLSKALQALAQAGIVTGTLGPTGGYRLAKAPKEISFLDIVEAVEGRKKTFNCSEIRGNNPCLPGKSQKPKGVCAIAKVMYNADEAWRDQLRDFTLEDLKTKLVETVSADLLKKSAEWFLEKK